MAGSFHFPLIQVLAIFTKPQRLAAVKKCFGPTCHAEPSRSDAADAYVWKEETRVADTQFELGRRPFKRNSETDWDEVRTNAQRGRLDAVPGDVFVRYYGNLKRIAKVFSFCLL